MPDFALCPGNGCPIKNSCLRYRAEPSEHQWFLSETPYREDWGCDHYILIGQGAKLRPPGREE
jgi:hypothetical protein